MAERTEAKDDPRQRKLGAITPEVIGDLLPAQMQAIPTSAAEFDGWTPDEVADWLKGMGGSFRQVRSVIGLALWTLRDKLKGEKEYVAYAHDLAEVYDVSVDTLTRWRRSAQVELGLPDPAGAAALTAAARKGAAAQSARQNAPIEEERQPASGGVRTSPVDVPTPSEQPERVIIDAETVEERPVTAPAPPAVEVSVGERVAEASEIDLESGIDAVLKRRPVDARPVPASKLRDLAGWVKQAQAVHSPNRSAAQETDGCSHKNAAGKDTTRHTGWGVVCDQCHAKIR